jgi:hypothetical protein
VCSSDLVSPAHRRGEILLEEGRSFLAEHPQDGRNTMREKALPPGSRRVLEALSHACNSALEGWTLAEGTGLALRIGHRLSEDFDFFRLTGMDIGGLYEAFRALGPAETLQRNENTLTVLLSGVKMSFFQVRDPFLFAPTRYLFFDIADTRDIALMKLAAITGRGSRKDFIDLFCILRSGPAMQDYLDLMARKCGAERTNLYQVVMSLTYFEDAEEEPMPKMLEPFDWEQCKSFFVRESRMIVLRP